MDIFCPEGPHLRAAKVPLALSPIPPEARVRRLAALLSVLACLATAAATLPASAGAKPRSGPASPALGIKHVFVIVLENESYSASYETNPNPYLEKC